MCAVGWPGFCLQCVIFSVNGFPLCRALLQHELNRSRAMTLQGLGYRKMKRMIQNFELHWRGEEICNSNIYHCSWSRCSLLLPLWCIYFSSFFTLWWRSHFLFCAEQDVYARWKDANHHQTRLMFRYMPCNMLYLYWQAFPACVCTCSHVGVLGTGMRWLIFVWLCVVAKVKMEVEVESDQEEDEESRGVVFGGKIIWRLF